MLKANYTKHEKNTQRLKQNIKSTIPSLKVKSKNVKHKGKAEYKLKVTSVF
jgi:hypothetical protein